MYEPTDIGVSLVVPPRQYELVASILAEAMDSGDDVASIAHEQGRKHGASRSRVSTTDKLLAVLDELGFEPRLDESREIVLGNCPFHSLAVRHPELICGLNQSYISGLLAGVGADQLRARLQPRPHDCCVQIAA